jgi:AraC-like DNA-binding protein
MLNQFGIGSILQAVRSRPGVRGPQSTGASPDELMQWIVENLTGGEAESVTLQGCWTSRVPGNWFFVYAVRRGSCRLCLDGQVRPLQLLAGDVVVLPQCVQHQLSDISSSGTSPCASVSWFDPAAAKDLFVRDRDRESSQTTLLIGRFRKPSRQNSMLFGALPAWIPFVASEQASLENLESTIALIEEELADNQPGCPRVIEHLVKVLILRVLRHQRSQPLIHGATPCLTTSDPTIVKALGLMHARPETAWTVATLAMAVGVSRSTFAARFTEVLGEPPQSYLRRERMQRAAELLSDDSLSVKEIAVIVGYDSESAFSHSFKRWCGNSPGRFRMIHRR